MALLRATVAAATLLAAGGVAAVNAAACAAAADDGACELPAVEFGSAEAEAEHGAALLATSAGVVARRAFDLGLVDAGHKEKKPLRWIIGDERDDNNKPQDPAGIVGGPDVHGRLRCGQTFRVQSNSSAAEVCPENCSYLAENSLDEDFCSFICVSESDCNHYFPGRNIGDKSLGVCRACQIDGCNMCDTSVLHDRCERCAAGYVLKGDGLCYLKFGAWVYFCVPAAAVLLLLVVLWVLDMHCRPNCNQEGIKHGLRCREKQKLRTKKDAQGDRRLFPITTNLLKANVAGPGMILHFKFQVFLMLWAGTVACIWACLATFVDPALWVIGTRPIGTPRENCILVAWGYETQLRLMRTKVLFLWIVYIGSFFMCLAYGVLQLRGFQRIDYDTKTMKDFVAMVVGLPNMSGSMSVEEALKAKLEAVTEQQVVGVSLCWEYHDKEEDIMKALREDLDARDAQHPAGQPPSMGPVRQRLFQWEQGLFGTCEEENASEEPITRILAHLHTSDHAFAVFETQEAMEAAVSRASGGFAFEGAPRVHLTPLSAEPDTVQWAHFGRSSGWVKVLKLSLGFLAILLACLVWATIFYAPYAYYVLTFNYDNGRQPGVTVSMAFTLVVVVGNAMMYEVCARVSDWVGFRFKDNREACYMILYMVACLCNVLLDFVTTYATAEKVMEGLGVRTYFGIPLQEITDFSDKFETYGMQRLLAQNTYEYAFPSTFLLPFILEPLPTIILPLWLGKLIVRSHPEVQGWQAAEWLGMCPMEMGRYADLLLNAILGVLIFYFPGGYTAKLFFFMVASHLWIYAFDHYRVLRSIPACTFASMDVEWWAEALLAPIVATIASALAFKMNCSDGMYCFHGWRLILLCCVVWAAHVALHLAALMFLVPLFDLPPPEDDPAADETFSSLAERLPCTWFTSNPVHCLRSQHHYKHSPPCSFCVPGREHLMRKNKAIGTFFEEADKDVEG